MARDNNDRNTLEILATDIVSYERWRIDKYPHLGEVLQEFPSLRLSATLLMAELPLLQQRFYSISSSPSMFPDEIHITVAVVRYNTDDGKGPEHFGVCSTWLNDIEKGDEIPCFTRAAPGFHLPASKETPMIMIGPGTGIAPLRSFWQQRQYEIMKSDKSSSTAKPGGSVSLYFGCRQPDMDDLYKKEVEEAKKLGAITNVYTAYSRQPKKPKTYVQHLLEENSKDVFEQIVEKEGEIYICGDVKMADDVMHTLTEIWEKEGSMTFVEADEFMIHLKENGRLHKDIFGASLPSSEVKTKLMLRARTLSSSSLEEFITRGMLGPQGSLDETEA